VLSITSQTFIDSPLSHFFESLQEKGHRICNLPDEADVIVSMNVHPRLMKRVVTRVPMSHRILVLWEPRVHKPENFKAKYISQFGHVFSPSPYWTSAVRHSCTHKFRFPQGQLIDSSFCPWEERKSEVVLFQSNKFSLIKGENFTLRRRVVHQLRSDFELYGSGWNSISHSLFDLVRATIKSIISQAESSISSYKFAFVRSRNVNGYIINKDEVMSTFKYSLVIENSSDYVSEKLFEVIRCGTIPIYIGPNLEDFGIPSSIAALAMPSVESIQQTLEDLKANKNLQRSILDSGREFMNSAAFKEHINSNVFSFLGSQICELLVSEVQGKEIT